MELPVSVKEIKKARELIGPYIKRTPLLSSDSLGAALGCRVYLKPECLQATGSFKVRGAVNKLLSLGEEEKAAGVVTASSGNHAQGVAFAGKALGIDVTVVLPEDVSEAKLRGCIENGAKIVKFGLTSPERRAKAEEIRREFGLASIHSYDDPRIMAGQGTVGLEILDDLADADCVVVPVGGGGLISGVATAIKETNSRVRIVGVEPGAAPRYTKSLEAGKPVTITAGSTCADALKAAQAGINNFPVIKRYADEILTVEDEWIRKAFAVTLQNAKVLAEPSSCIGIAAALSGKLRLNAGEKAVFLLSGGNIGMDRIVRLLSDDMG